MKDKQTASPRPPAPESAVSGADVPWEAGFAAREAWSARQEGKKNRGNGGAAGKSAGPSVSAIAGLYRRDPWAVLASTILSLRTKDEVTLAASERLLKKAPTPAALLSLGEEEITRLVYPVGFYRTKAANLVKIARILLEQEGGRVPADMDALLALPGVGRKTANLVLSEAFGIDAVCVDIHVHRISNRMGWFGPEGTSAPDKTEAALRAILPKKYWRRINMFLVRYGQTICRPISPHCSRCVVSAWCSKAGVGKSR
ncbi:MAG: endonuclease III [Spirochaetaceae bacterium]|jgi:endonuclease-3|nr:endonuclease III [Spirochaetaceae bacterium]